MTDLIKRTPQLAYVSQPAQRMIRLVPLAMVVPNREGVYNLSQYQAPEIVTESEWRAYSPIDIKVGTPERWRWAVAYGKGLSGWYLAVDEVTR